jgi:uncharacterized protein YbaP (TraB family)
VRRLAIRLALTWAAVLLAGTAVVPAQAAEPVFLWQVASETATVTLVGSIHVGQEEFYPLPDVFEESFAGADALAVEVDITNPENVQKSMTLMMEQGMLPEGETLMSRLGEDLWNRLVEFAGERGTPLAMYSRFKPGIVAMILVMEEYQRVGFDPELGVDQHFLKAARAQGKEVRELETIEDQMELFFMIDDELDDVLMAEMLDQMADIETMTGEMVDLWQKGDAAGLDSLLLEQMGDDPAMEKFYRRLLDDRNVAMAEKIDAWLGEDADVFVVVGAGHFAGEMGIINLLEQKGWKVEQGAGEFAAAE